jgi:predicted enzyme related to lactoylglutathione lyase
MPKFTIRRYVMTAHGHFHWNELITHNVERAKKFYADTLWLDL